MDGNHENFELLHTCPICEWHGGQVRVIRPSVLRLTRGQVYEIGGKRIFTMGGASSHDIQDGVLEPDDPAFEEKLRRLDAAGALSRVDYRFWWVEELPSEDELQAARKTLDSVSWEADYIVSRCCPGGIQEMFGGDLYQRNALTDFFDEVRTQCRFQYWFFRHYHENMVIEKKFVMLYERIIRLEQGKWRE